MSDIVLPIADENLIVGLTTLNWAVIGVASVALINEFLQNKTLEKIVLALFSLLVIVLFVIGYTQNKTNNETLKAYIVSTLLLLTFFSLERVSTLLLKDYDLVPKNL